MKNTVILLISIATFIACTKQKAEQVSTIDSTLQVSVDSILQNKLSELNATVGQVIIMEVRTGEIKVSVGSDSILQESGLVRIASLLAVLETKAVKLSDSIDVADGVLAIGKDTLCDHNWHRGGYGKITVEQGFGVASNIANYKIVKKVFENEQAFSEALAKYGYQVKDTSLVYNPLGYGILTTACKTDKTSVPQEFECFNQPHIYIKYKQPINGYTVKVMWLQYGEVGNALFCLEKQGVQYYYFAEKWTDKILYDKGNTYPHNTVIELDYTAKLKSEEYLSDDSPFFFSDVDFDGEEEFIINRYKSGSRDSNAYDVYDVSPYGYFIQKTEVPFTELENGQCKFDSENKTITVFGSNGWNNAIRHIYQLKDRKFELVQSE